MTPAPSPVIDINPPPGSRLRFVSDLHFGHDRGEAPEPRLLAPLLDGVDMLVVVGDLAETRPCANQARGLAAREAFRGLCRTHGVELVEISGNHDPDIHPLLARFWGGKAVAMHGHALYKEVAPWSWEYLNFKSDCKKLIAGHPASDTDLADRLELSRAMCQLHPPIMRRNDNIRNRCIRSFLHCFWPPERPLHIVWGWLTCARRAERFARTFFPEAETLILGHFHRSGHWRFRRRHIYNTGAWFKHATPCYLDMQDAKVLAYGKVADVLPSYLLMNR